MFDSEFTKLSVTFGIGLGVFNIVFIIFMWITKLDTKYYHIGKTIELLVSIVPVIVILAGIYKINLAKDLTIGKRLSAGIIIGLISMIIAVPFTEIYHLYINPEWFDAVLRLKEQQMSEAGATQSEIVSQLERMKANNTVLNSVIGAFAFGGLIFPALVSLFSYIFIRNK